MSTAETILSRWSRRKLESARNRESTPARQSPRFIATETDPATGKEVIPVAPPETIEPAWLEFDPASLPAIETIAADTDIRSFLKLGVPAELTRNALRRAWAADPAIRDFIGVAENQWDFNDPVAIPGFGPLRTTDDAAGLAAQMLGKADDAFRRITGLSAPAPQAMQGTDSAKGGEPVDEHRRAPDPSINSRADAEITGSAEERDKENIETKHDSAVGEGGSRRHYRSHGGALPK